MMEQSKTKKQLRREVLEKRNDMTETERVRASVMMTERLLGHQWFYLSDTILGFAGYGSEISTDELLEEALRIGKKVFLPKVIGDDMVFYRIHSLNELTEGYKGIREPALDTEVYLYDESHVNKTMMLMPGVVFDGLRNRIGYGKGFYDRYLSDKPDLQLRTIAIGFKCQLVETVPVSDNDIRPYQVILF